MDTPIIIVSLHLICIFLRIFTEVAKAKNAKATALNSTTIYISWSMPDLKFENVELFHIYCSEEVRQQNCSTITTYAYPQIEQYEVVMPSHTPCTEYPYKIAALTVECRNFSSPRSIPVTMPGMKNYFPVDTFYISLLWSHII